MYCPKCKKEIDDNSLKCSHCGVKIGSLCPKCGAYNLLTSIECSKCGKELLKICSECGAANLPNSKKCRKCEIEFVKKEEAQEKFQPVYSASMSSQQKIKAKLVEGIKDADVRIITVCGESGLGKNIVLRSAISELKNAKLIWLFGSCTQISQLSPFGYFQDLLLSFFNINNFCPDTLQLKKNSIKFFKQDFPLLSNDEIHDLLNFLYPEMLDRYENIYYNKVKMFTIIKKVILTIVEKMKVVFIIDNFEYIDGMSYDFLKELLNEEIIKQRSKFIILSSVERPGMGMIYDNSLQQENYLDLTIAPFTDSQIEVFLKQYNDFNFGKDFLNLVIKVSQGNPAIIEQMVLLYSDLKKIGYGVEPAFRTLDSIMEQRLMLLKSADPSAYRMLVAMSILGVKFYPAMLETVDNNTVNEFERIIETLVKNGFITQLNNLAFEFKSNCIWKSIVSFVKNDSQFEEILNILYELLSSYKQSSLALLGYIVQKLNNNDQSFDIWTLLMKQASYIGDIGLYIITQKQALKLIENKVSDFYVKVKKNIHTRIGKLLEPIDFNTSFEHLQQAIMMLEDDDEAEHIELLGYLASCTMKQGNYCGTIECIENVLNKILDVSDFEKTLVKSKLVKPLLKLGNYGQVINLVETELLQDIEKYLRKGKDLPQIRIKELFDLWLDIYFDLTEAFIFQGNNKCFETIQIILPVLIYTLK